MERRPGMGVLLQMLGGNEATVEAHNAAVGKTISSVAIRKQDEEGDVWEDAILMHFTDGTGIRIWDGGQSCCEHRYMNCDDDLSYHVGAEFKGAEIRETEPEEDGEYGDVHEIEFLHLNTSKGVITVANHNLHNGYYGGFYVKIAPLPDPPTP